MIFQLRIRRRKQVYLHSAKLLTFIMIYGMMSTISLAYQWSVRDLRHSSLNPSFCVRLGTELMGQSVYGSMVLAREPDAVYLRGPHTADLPVSLQTLLFYLVTVQYLYSAILYWQFIHLAPSQIPFTMCLANNLAQRLGQIEVSLHCMILGI